MFSTMSTSHTTIISVYLAISVLAAPAPANFDVDVGIEAIPTSTLPVPTLPVPVPVPAPEPQPTAPYASTNANQLLWTESDPAVAGQPIRGSLGASILGPQNVAAQLQNADLVAPPSTGAGTVDVLLILLPVR